jgi:hypothetical protein
VTGALAGPYVAGAGLLGLAGVAKLINPVDTAGALRAAGLTRKKLATRPQHASVRLGAVVEVAVAVAALTAPGPLPALAVAASYAGFAVFVAVALRRGWPLASCGCFGRPDTPPTVNHALLNAAAAGVAVGWAVTGPDRVSTAFATGPWSGAPLALAATAICALAYLLFTYPLTHRRPGR